MKVLRLDEGTAIVPSLIAAVEVFQVEQRDYWTVMVTLIFGERMPVATFTGSGTGCDWIEGQGIVRRAPEVNAALDAEAEAKARTVYDQILTAIEAES